jgi:hypothetical protein
MTPFRSIAVLFCAALATEARGDEAVALKMIKERGGTYEVDREKPGEPVVSVSLPGRNVTSDDIRQLKALTELRNLSFNACTKPWPTSSGKLTDEGVKELAAMKNLRSLDLAGHTAITDTGLKELKALENLETLVLMDHAKITDAGLQPLYELKHLRNLTIRFTGVTLAGVTGLKETKSLKFLRIGNNAGFTRKSYLGEVKEALPEVQIDEVSIRD